MGKTITALGLLIVTTALSLFSFRLYHKDFFYLREHYRRVTTADHAQVLRIADRVDFQDKRNAAVSMMLGEALMNVGEADMALTVVKNQVRLHPDDLGILETYANMLTRAGRRDEADVHYRKLLERLRPSPPVSLRHPARPATALHAPTGVDSLRANEIVGRAHEDAAMEDNA